MSLFKKNAPASPPSFSNVQKGGSTTADGSRPDPATPAPSAPSTTTRGVPPDFSNVRSGGSSTAPTREAARSTTYVVRSGDSLSRIAKRHYGDASQWTRIYEANRGLIGANPDLIHPGQELVLPQA